MHRGGADMSPVTRELSKSNADPKFVEWLRDIEKVSKLILAVGLALPGTCAIAACNLERLIHLIVRLFRTWTGLQINARSVTNLRKNQMALKASDASALIQVLCESTAWAIYFVQCLSSSLCQQQDLSPGIVNFPKEPPPDPSPKRGLSPPALPLSQVAK